MFLRRIARPNRISLYTGQAAANWAMANWLVAAAKLPVPKIEELQFKPRSEWRYIGKDSNALFDLPDMVTGKAMFGMDAGMPGMVYASIEHPPVLGQKIKSYDDKEALNVPGVKKTLTIDTVTPPHLFKPLGGVAVIGDNTWATFKGRKALKVEWGTSPHSSYNSAEYRKTLEATALRPGKVVRNMGDVDAEFAKGGKIVEAKYYAPHLAHASMEPPVAVAEYRDGKVLAYAPTQNPQAVQETVAAVLGIKKEDVTCHVTLLGGGFGRKSKPDQVAEAALLSKQLGKPVKVVWTREDDIKFDFFHSVAAMYMKAAMGPNGMPSAWLQRSVFPPIASTFDASAKYGDDEMGLGWNNLPFDIPNHRAENGPADYQVRIGWLRSVANIYHAFAIHSFADELAHNANKDSVEYLLALIGPSRIVKLDLKGDDAEEDKAYPLDTARLSRVVEIVAEKSNWAKQKKTAGHGFGIAAHRSFLTYVATVVEVEVDNKGQVQIPNVWTAVDAGTVVSPDNIRNQFEGAAVFGTSLALFGEITATNGVINQTNFNDYQVTRMSRAPRKIDVQIVKSEAPPAGVGEPVCLLSRLPCTTRCLRRLESGCARCRYRRQNWSEQRANKFQPRRGTSPPRLFCFMCRSAIARGTNVRLYSSTKILCLAQTSFSASGHTVTLTSPRCAFRSRSISVRDWPIPPPIESGMRCCRIAP